jgi:hypothetical protein
LLAIVSNPFGRKGKWISMFQDFNFKIVHRAGARHANVNALNRNPFGLHDEDEDFGVEIQDESYCGTCMEIHHLESTYPYYFPGCWC